MPDWFWYIPGPTAVALYVTYYYWSRRNQASILAAEARVRGWRYDATDRGLLRRYSGWPFDSRGRKVRHVIRGTHRSREFVCYELSFRMNIGYRYADDGLVRNRCRYQVVSTAHDGGQLPDLTIANADTVSRFSSTLFDEGTGIGSDEFRRKFSLSTGDGADASAVVAGPMSEWLAADPRASRNPLKFEKGDVITWRSGALNIARAIEPLDYLNDVVDRLPPVGGMSSLQ